MCFRALLISMVVFSAAEAAPILQDNDTAFYEKMAEESTGIFRGALKLPIGSTREAVIRHIDDIARAEVRAENRQLTVRSLAHRRTLKRVALLCGLEITASREEIIARLNSIYGGTDSATAERTNWRISVEMMHVLADALNRPVTDFYDWDIKQIDNMLSALPDTPLE